MKVYFRTDASTRIGTGHVMRCLSLARELAAGGASVAFICRAHQGHMAEYIRQQEGYAVHLLPEADVSGPPPGESVAHADWLGADWSIDARQTSEIIRSLAESADWIVVDHYAIDQRWEKALRPATKGIFVIDDLADRAHDCDLLLDQNLHDGMEKRYASLVPPECRVLLGPGYALLRDEFGATREKLRDRDGRVRRILIFFGGADADDETGKALEACKLSRLSGIAIDVVLGGANRHKERILSICEGIEGAVCHLQTRNMAALMAGADLSLGAGGTATWERCCTGLPTLCISIADNQISIARTAAEHGLLRYLGHFDQVSRETLSAALLHAVGHPDALATMSSHCLATVDGKGAERTCAAMIETGAS